MSHASDASYLQFLEGAVDEWRAAFVRERDRADATEARLAAIASALGLDPRSDLVATVRILRASADPTPDADPAGC